MKNIVRVILLLSIFTPKILANEVAAKKDGVSVLSEASKKGTAIVTLKKGDTVDAKERKGMYWEVVTKDGKKGFVSVMEVAKKSGAEDADLAKAIRSAVKQGREGEEEDAANNRARSTVMGVRGLDEGDTANLAGNVKPNLRMVYSMEDKSLSKKDLEEFGDLVMREVELRAEKKSE